MWSSPAARPWNTSSPATTTPWSSLAARPASSSSTNLKTGVLRHPVGERAAFNPSFLDFAAHYGFEARACNVRKSPTKKAGLKTASAM